MPHPSGVRRIHFDVRTAKNQFPGGDIKYVGFISIGGRFGLVSSVRNVGRISVKTGDILKTDKIMSGAFANNESLIEYVIKRFRDVTKQIKENEIVLDCTTCQTNIAFQIIQKENTQMVVRYASQGRYLIGFPIMYQLQCPGCKQLAVWIVYEFRSHNGTIYYRLLSLPGESGVEIPELPSEPPSLRLTFDEAIRGLEANNPMSACVMFRRALQIITRDILGAPRSKLHRELDWLTKNQNRLNLNLSWDFHSNAYIIKEVSNQGAHPDEDVDLIDLTHEDAKALYQLFLEVIHEVFSIPAAREATRQQLMKRRKIIIPSFQAAA